MLLNEQQKFLKGLLEDSMTKSQIDGVISKLIDHVKQIKEKNIKDLENMGTGLNQASEALKNATQADFGALKAEINTLIDDHINDRGGVLKGIIDGINERVDNIKDGKDADEEVIVEKVLDKIELPKIDELKKDIPVLGDEIRNSLELLNDEERLDVSAIKGLEEMLKKWEKKLYSERLRFVGGTPRPQFIDSEDLVGTKNGTNKVFTINNFPSPATSLKIFRNGQRLKLTTDYTLSGKTITLVTDVAPASDELLYADYTM